jgi:phosphoglycerate dehydrogenase-like enzyme
MRCVILDDYQDVAGRYADWAALADLETRAIDRHLEGEQLVEVLAGAEVVVAMRERTRFDAELLDRLPDLRLLVTTGMRNAAIDVEAATARGITVCGTGFGSDSTAELTWALILGLARHLRVETIDRGSERWQQTVGTDLYGATLGLIGAGRIGADVARVGAAFGMDVIAWSPHLDDERAAAAGARRVGSLAELMASADVVSVHMVLGASSRGLVDAAAIAAMRPTAYFVNTSRAGLVDMAALTDALREGRIAGAGLDVYDVEPVPLDDELRRLPTVLGTPHLGYVSESNYRRFFAEVVEDVAAWRAGEPVRVLG